MIFNRERFFERPGILHQLGVHGLGLIYRIVRATEAFYAFLAIHRRTDHYQRFRRGRWGTALPSLWRTLRRTNERFDRMIVAHSFAAEKPAAQGWTLDLLGGALALLQLCLALLLVLLFWVVWPSSAAAPTSATALRFSSASGPDPALSAPGEPQVQAQRIEDDGAAASQPAALAEERIGSVGGAEAALNDSTGTESAASTGLKALLVRMTQNSRNDAPLAAAVDAADPNALQASAEAAVENSVVAEATVETSELVSAIWANAADSSAAEGSASVGQIEPTAKDIEIVTAFLDVILASTAPAPPDEFPSIPAAPTVGNFPSHLELGPSWSNFVPPAASRADHFWLGPAFPAGYNQIYSTSYQFGSTAGGRYRPHHGLDISNPAGTPVLAMVSGKVIHAGPDNPTLLGPYNNFYGNTVVIRLDRKLYTSRGMQDVYLLFGHLEEVNVERGERVTRETPVGAVGMTGIAVGPHLHIEVRVGQNSYLNTINPALWMQPAEGTGSLAVRLVNSKGRSWSGAKVNVLWFEGESSRWVRTIETYRPLENLSADPIWGENGAASNLNAGYYYVTAEVNGEQVGQMVELRAGETTFVELRTQQ